ncbi:hypothetical protein RsTz2092_06200 [Deferribacterales bacterium RsTz2092]|nr:hypothetical protein AGMMS49941_03070 [Deferribacterales bacterium]
MFFSLFSKNVTITIKNQNRSLAAKTGASLYEFLVQEGIIPEQLCRGGGQCGRCKLYIDNQSLKPPTRRERASLAQMSIDAGFRLACQTTITGNMSIDVSTITSPPVSNPLDMTVPDMPSEEELVKIKAEIAAAVQSPKYISPVSKKNVIGMSNTGEMNQMAAKTLAAVPASSEQPISDGILLVQSGGRVHFFVYSAAINSVIQEGTLDINSDLVSYLANNSINALFANKLSNLNDIERIIVITDEPSSAANETGEQLLGLVSYERREIGLFKCDFIHPIGQPSDFNLFLHLLSLRERNRLLVSLDNVNKIYFVSASKVVLIPSRDISSTNLIDVLPTGDNPILDVSDDFQHFQIKNEYSSPNALSLPLFMRVANQLVKRKLADANFNLYPRAELDPSVPLEYQVKVAKLADGASAFYLYRKRGDLVMITQNMLTMLLDMKNNIRYAVEFVEKTLQAGIEGIELRTSQKQQGLLASAIETGIIPKRYENATSCIAGEQLTTALKLFQERDLREYIKKYLGEYASADQQK